MHKTCDNPVANIVFDAMHRCGLKSRRDLAKASYMGYQVVDDRLNQRSRWKLDEIQYLDKVLDFTEAECVRLVKGEQHGRWEAPELKSEAKTEKLDRLIKGYETREDVQVYDLIKVLGMPARVYYRKIGKYHEQGQEQLLSLDELRKIGESLRIPKEEMLEAIWEAMEYETPCLDEG